MITKAIVEEVVSPYQVKVRVPILDKTSNAVLATSADSLNIATICTLPNCYINIKVGDIVFVAFEDNTYYKAVVLGHLCREATTTSYADITVDKITSNSTARFSDETYIGEVTPENIKQLVGCSDNIQEQLNLINARINNIMTMLGGA